MTDKERRAVPFWARVASSLCRIEMPIDSGGDSRMFRLQTQNKNYYRHKPSGFKGSLGSRAHGREPCHWLCQQGTVLYGTMLFANRKGGIRHCWACEKFHVYLYGIEFDLWTDHKPLEPSIQFSPGL